MHTDPARAIGFREFVVLIAAIMSCQALAVDAMLPALPTMAADLGVFDENRTQWVVTLYIAGLGVGQLIWGVISDRFGRRPILLTALALYAAASALASTVGGFESLLAWRFVHGLAAAGLVVTRSITRDLYAGRQMARVMSLIVIIFIIVPVVAPSIGQLLLLIASWRALFLIFAVVSVLVWVWCWRRLPETLHPQYRMTLTLGHVFNAAARVLTERSSLWYTLGAAILFGAAIAYIGMVQRIFADVFHEPALMPTMFALCAAASGVTSYLNSRIVERIGMRIISQIGMFILIAVSGLHVLVAASGHDELVVFVAFQAAVTACFGLILGNFGAMAMEEIGAVAGAAASVQGFVSTLGGSLVAAVIGHFFNGSTLPLALGFFGCSIAAMLCVLLAERGRLFRPHHASAGAASSMSLAAGH